MKGLKAIVSLLLALSLVFGLCGCNGKTEASAPSEPVETTSPSAGTESRSGFDWSPYEDNGTQAGNAYLGEAAIARPG